MKIGGKTKWVLLVSINPGGANGGSATQYFIGDFDGKTFKNDNPSNEILWLDYGRDNYAGVTWSNAPNNRRIFLGWMSNWDYAQKVPTEKWRSAMTLPRELALKQTEKGLRLVQNPVKETEILRDKKLLDERKLIVLPEATIPNNSSLSEIIIEADLSKTTAKEFGIEINNSKGDTYRIGYNLDSKRFISDRTNSGKKDFSDIFAKNKHFASRLSNNNRLKLHLFFDKASAEMFADDGEIAMTDIFFPTEDFTKFKIYSNGEVFFTQAKAWNLKSIWR